MNIKTTLIALSSIILLGLFFFYFDSNLASENQVTPQDGLADVVAPEAAAEVEPVPIENSVQNPTSNPVQNSGGGFISKNTPKDMGEMLKTPILFYGKVVDENGNPIEGAHIVLTPVQKAYEENSTIEKTTDRNGLFSIKTRGMGLNVMTSKEGYYRVEKSDGNFDYVDLGSTNYKLPHINPNDPAVFVLKKMGATESLVKVADFGKDFRIPKDGTPIRVDLVTGDEVKEGSDIMQVEAWTLDQVVTASNLRIPYDWRCRITVPGGGLIERTGEFNFEAPAEGYQTSAEIVMPAILGQDWKRQVSKSYFLKLKSGKFARIDFIMSAAGSHFFTVDSILNPSGSRNLEFDPKKQLQWNKEENKLIPVVE